MRLKKRDLILQEMMTLLRENRSMSVKELSEIISSKYGVDPSYISKIKSELEREGLIKTESVGRSKVIHLVEPESKISVLAYMFIPVAAVISAVLLMYVPEMSLNAGNTVHALGEGIQVVYIPVIPKNLLISTALIGFSFGYFLGFLFKNKKEKES